MSQENELKECIDEKQQAQWNTVAKKHSTLKKIMRGLIISLPIVIILIILSLIFKLIVSFVSPISQMISASSDEPGIVIHLISISILLLLFYSLGHLVNHRKGKFYFQLIERKYLMKIPLYSAVRDLVHTFVGVKEMPFSKVVLVDPYNTGVLMTGFVSDQIEEDRYTVFVPTAPNPTNGNIYHVPSSQVTHLKVSTEVAMRTIVGMGTGSNCLVDPKVALSFSDSTSAEKN